MRSITTDLLVYGGGFAGVAAACAAAAAGRRVCLVERRSYPGTECTATLRPWLRPDQHEELRTLFGWAGDFVGTPANGSAELPVVPDRLKLALEDRLLEAGVALLYCMRPVALSYDGSLHVRLAGKGGGLEVTAAAAVDASAELALVRLARPVTPRVTQGVPQRLWRTQEWTGVALDRLAEAAVPAGVGVAVEFHAGHATELGHLLVAQAFDVPTGADSQWPNEAGLHLRLDSMRLARWLKEEHPAFAGARLTEIAQDLLVPPQWRDSGQGGLPVWAADGPVDPAHLARLGWETGLRAAHPPQLSSIPVIAPRVPERLNLDVLVIGGGTSGVGAAIGAARRGCRTLLADMNPALGGAGTVGGVDSYWFGRRGGFNAEVSRWVADEQQWMNWTGSKWNVEAKISAWQNAALREGVGVLANTVLVEMRMGEGRQVTGALLATPSGLVEVAAAVVVDATGDGDAAVMAGAKAVYGSDREGMTMWYSMAPHVRPGMTQNNFTSTVDVGDPFDYTRAILSARRRLQGHDHGPYVAPRESRHIIGGVRLTLADILTMRRWPDVINVHFSNHDVKGQNCSDWLRMGLIPPNLEIEMPYRVLVPEGVEGLLVTGKGISCTHDALPPVRMQADLENLGYVCGTAAGLCAGRGLPPRDLPVDELQQVLADEGLLPPDRLHRIIDAAAPSAESMQAWVGALDDGQRLYLLAEMEMQEICREPIPMVQVCTAGPAILPILRVALRPGSRRRLSAARALAWYGDNAATPVLLEAIEPYLAEGVVPPRTAHIRYTQASPDHGAMPELAYLLHSLAMARDPRSIPVLMQVAERLNPTRERLQDQMSGLFHYVDAICDVAERLGSPHVVPVLKRLHNYELFRGRRTTAPHQADYFEERLAYLELVIARAMARCGCVDGARILADYLRDSRRALVRHAYQELCAISGESLPPDAVLWEDWLNGRAALPSTPWMGYDHQ